MIRFIDFQEDTEIAWDWEENRENEEEPEICPPRILLPDSNKSARLLKVRCFVIFVECEY